MLQLPAIRNIPSRPGYKAGDVMVIFGELFARGYVNGIVEEAERAGLKIIRSTVGRRDQHDNLRALTEDELSSWPKPYINIPLEAGFDLDHASDGKSPVDQLHGVKMSDWNQVQLDWTKIAEAKAAGLARFQKHLQAYMQELQTHIPKGANVIFVHTMAGGVPRAKILMPTMNKVFKGTGDRYVESELFWQSDIGKLSSMNFDEVTANTFTHLIQYSSDLRGKIEHDGGSVRYLAYGYHGTEVLVKDEYTWQTYTPYVQGWAKMKLENIAKDATTKGIKACVYNCPEILTNSSSIFIGLEVSLYPLMGALRKEGRGHARAEKLLAQCQSMLKAEHTIDEVLRYTDNYLRSDLLGRYLNFSKWPQHNGKDQMEFMIQSSEHLVEMHRDPKQLINFLLSEEVFKATGLVMFRDSWQPANPVAWLNHDVLAKAMATEL